MMPLREIADTWSSLYSHSAALRSVVSFAHVGGLVTGGGYAIANDIGTLKAIRLGGERISAEVLRVQAAHRVVIGSLMLVVASGVLLLLADLDAYLESTAFWIKMGLVACLMINGAALMRVTARMAEDRGRVRLQLVTITSLMLWFATTFLGTVVPNAL